MYSARDFKNDSRKMRASGFAICKPIIQRQHPYLRICRHFHWHGLSGVVDVMLETIAIVLILLWLLGMVSSYTMGGFIHILLVIAVIVLLVRLIQGETRLTLRVDGRGRVR